MTEVMTSVYELMGKVSEGCKEETQIKAKVDNLFKVKKKYHESKFTLKMHFFSENGFKCR